MTTPDPAGAAERRILTRYPVRAGATVECHRGPEGLGPDLTVDPLNLSETGIRLLLREAVAVGEVVRLRLIADGLPEPLVRQGKVVWSLGLPASDYYFAGVHFDRPLPREQLEQLIAPAE
jgi:hypothetical protein